LYITAFKSNSPNGTDTHTHADATEHISMQHSQEVKLNCVPLMDYS